MQLSITLWFQIWLEFFPFMTAYLIRAKPMYRHPSLSAVKLVPEKQSTKWGTHKCKHSETRINSIILYFLRGRLEHYSETALSKAHYSEGYLYLVSKLSNMHTNNTGLLLCYHDALYQGFMGLSKLNTGIWRCSARAIHFILSEIQVFNTLIQNDVVGDSANFSGKPRSCCNHHYFFLHIQET
jgi:hypothetical protein